MASSVQMDESGFTIRARQAEYLRAICSPDFKTLKDVAFGMGLTHASLKQMVNELYVRLGWPGGQVRMLVLYAIAHHEVLHIPLPDKQAIGHTRKRVE